MTNEKASQTVPRAAHTHAGASRPVPSAACDGDVLPGHRGGLRLLGVDGVEGLQGSGEMSDWHEVTIGPCRLIRGDCLSVLPALDSGCVDACITDPPYGMDFQSARRIESESFARIANDTQPFVWWCWPVYRLVKDGGCVMCFCRWDDADAFRDALRWARFTVKSQCVWDRGNHGLGDLNGSPGPRHDTIWMATKGRFTFHGRRPVSVLSHMMLSGADLTHPNEKPVELMSELCEDYCPFGGTVLDPFSGSGTTGVGCIRTGRNFIGIEQDETHFESMCNRIRREWQLKCSELPFEEKPSLKQRELL